MKPLVTIFLLFTLLWLQFSKQLTYFHCALTQTFSATHCNCEDILAWKESNSNNDMPIQKTNISIAPDEFYTVSCYTTAAITPIKYIVQIKGFQMPLYNFYFFNNLLRPPRC